MFLFLFFFYIFSVSFYLFFLNFLFFLILKSLILTCIPKHEPPSHLPPHNISLGHPHAPAPSKLHPTSDMDWRFNSYMTVYMLEFPLIHFEFIFVYGVRKCSNFILLHVAVKFSQCHLLKRLSLPHCIFLPPLSKIRYP